MESWLEYITGVTSVDGRAFAFADWTVRVTVMMGAACGIVRVFRGQSASLRHLVWFASLLGVLGLPLAIRWTPGWQVPSFTEMLPRDRCSVTANQLFCVNEPHRDDDSFDPSNRFTLGTRCGDAAAMVSVLPGAEFNRSAGFNDQGMSPSSAGMSSTNRVAEKSSRSGSSAVAVEGAISEVSAASRDQSSLREFGRRISSILNVGLACGTFVWLSGVLLMLAPLAVGFVSLSQLKRRSISFTPDLNIELNRLKRQLAIRREVKGILTETRTIPMTWGLWRPVLLLPVEAVNWSENRRCMVLLHELAHISRGDFVTQLVGQLARAMQWFNPLVWFANSQLRLEQERACDDIVLNAGAIAEDYAEELLSVTSHRSRSAWDVSLALAMNQSPSLEGRLKAILDGRQNRESITMSRRAWVMVLSVLVLGVVASAGRASNDFNDGTTARLATNGDEANREQTGSRDRREAIPGENAKVAELSRRQEAVHSKGHGAAMPSQTNAFHDPSVMLLAQVATGDAASTQQSKESQAEPVNEDSLKSSMANPRVSNGDFEAGTDSEGHPEGWFATILPHTKDFVEFRHSSDGRETTGKAGRKCALLSIKSNHPDTPIFYNWVRDIEGWNRGQSYVVSAWVKTENVKKTPFIVIESHDLAGQPLTLHSSELVGRNQRTESGKAITGTRDWTRLTVHFRVHKDAKKVIARFGLPTTENAGAKVWFDDISVEPTTEDVPETHVDIPKPVAIAPTSDPTLDLVRSLIATHSVKPIDSRVLTEGAIKGMMEALKDEHSTVFTAEQMTQLMTGASSVAGIGVEVRSEKPDVGPEIVRVHRVFPNSPAEKAGVKRHDIIVTIEGKAVSTTNEAAHAIRGAVGTPVNLKLQRLDGSSSELSIVRANVFLAGLPPVVGLGEINQGQWQHWLDRKEGVAYVRLTQFSVQTAEKLEAILKQLQADGMKGLVIDLRGNAGGLLPECIKVASLFIQEGTVVRIQERNKPEQELSVTGMAPFSSLPLIAVIDGTTASAAEVLSGALQDHKRAVLVGDRTYGKGSIQSLHPLGESGVSIKLTVAEMTTPNRHRFQRNLDAPTWGINPTDGWYVPMEKPIASVRSAQEIEKVDALRTAGGAEPGNSFTPEVVETTLQDRPLAAAWKALNGKLSTGEFTKTGLTLNDQQRQLARKEMLARERDALRLKLQQLEKELGQ